MARRATEFLNEWTLKRETAPISRHEAEAVAERWEGEAADNGIGRDELRAAAGGSLPDYLLRTFGDRTLDL
jgi:hypothetical protein